MKLSKKSVIREGREFRKIIGITKGTLVDDIAKKFSKRWFVTAFARPSDKGGLLVVKRLKPLSKSFKKFISWERGRGL